MQPIYDGHLLFSHTLRCWALVHHEVGQVIWYTTCIYLSNSENDSISVVADNKTVQRSLKYRNNLYISFKNIGMNFTGLHLQTFY